MKTLLAKDTDLHYITGLEKYEFQDYNGAIDDYNRAIEANKNHPWAYNDRGEAKRKLNDLTGAIADHTISIENYPTHTRGYICGDMQDINLETKTELVRIGTRQVSLERRMYII